MQNRSLILSLAVASCLAGAAASAEPNTGEWTCSKCPFETKGYESNVQLGGGYLTESSAKFGDYTGLTDKGGYVVADADGRYTSESGYHLSYGPSGLPGGTGPTVSTVVLGNCMNCHSQVHGSNHPSGATLTR